MKAQDLQFTRLLEGSKQFIIPIFQRTDMTKGGLTVLTANNRLLQACQ